MLSIRSASAALLLAGLAVLAFELHRAPGHALTAIALFAIVWVVRERVIRKQRHQHSFHHLKRQVMTTAVVSALLVAIGTLALTAVDMESDAAPFSVQGTTAADDQVPWTAGFLVDGVLTIAAVAWLIVGARGVQRRSRHHHADSAPA